MVADSDPDPQFVRSSAYDLRRFLFTAPVLLTPSTWLCPDCSSEEFSCSASSSSSCSPSSSRWLSSLSSSSLSNRFDHSLRQYLYPLPAHSVVPPSALDSPTKAPLALRKLWLTPSILAPRFAEDLVDSQLFFLHYRVFLDEGLDVVIRRQHRCWRETALRPSVVRSTCTNHRDLSYVDASCCCCCLSPMLLPPLLRTKQHMLQVASFLACSLNCAHHCRKAVLRSRSYEMLLLPGIVRLPLLVQVHVLHESSYHPRLPC